MGESVKTNGQGDAWELPGALERRGALMRQETGEYESWRGEGCSPPYCLVSSLFPSCLPLLPCRSLGYT